MKKVFLIFSLVCIFLLSGCSNDATPVEQPKPKENIPEKQYSIIENEEKYIFPISQVTVDLTSEEWNYNIFNDYDILLDTNEEITNFPYLYNEITVLNTAPKVYIIPRFYQQQYEITDVSLENGIITIKYRTENNALIDRLIGQITNIKYTLNFSQFIHVRSNFRT